ncbi:MAG: efflux RND transporter periplasmic adaptor subunit [Candidatus Poribacteria bacterium]|nr:efflux RND transporter periplasmic adaptor subunit [Candidatus Poribacteria bacterium]MDE0503682.1 efflux RND transporter periplasmic adaptor subunit [Candidatus Poribacteria bacterium]
MKKSIFAIIAIVIVGIILLRVVTKQQPDPADVSASVALKPVEVVQARLATIESVLELSGTIVPNSRVTVFPEVPGRLVEMYVDEGSRVKSGDTMAVIDHDDLELQLTQADAAFQSAQVNYEQVKQLAEGRIKVKIDVAEADVSSAKAALQQVMDLAETRAVSQIEGAEAGLTSLQANLEKIKRGAREEDRKQAQATLHQAVANFENAQSNYERMQKLFTDGAISTQSLEASQTQLDVAKAQRDIASEQIRIIENGARAEDVQSLEALVRQAEAALKVARAQITTRTWEKDITLAEAHVKKSEANLSAAKDLENARSWEAEILMAEAAMKQAEAASSLARERLADATIVAPISGIVAKRHLDVGGMALPTAPLIEIVEMDSVKAVFSVIESDLGKLNPRRHASIRLDALENPVTGEISLIGPTLDPSSRTAKIEIRIANPGLKLKPGMFARATIPVEVHENAVLIPRSSVLEDANRGLPSVFVVTDGLGRRRTIEIGLTQGSDVEVTQGVVEGDNVVVAGQHALTDGENVTVVPP